MREFSHRLGPFEKFTPGQSKQLMGDVVDLLAGSDVYPIGAITHIAHWRASTDQERRQLRDPYYPLLVQALVDTIIVGTSLFQDEEIRVVLAEQKEFGAHAGQLYRELKVQPFGRFLKDLETGIPLGSPGLQAADLLAYELQKHYTEETAADERRPIRWPLRTLLDALEVNPRYGYKAWRFLTLRDYRMMAHGHVSAPVLARVREAGIGNLPQE